MLCVRVFVVLLFYFGVDSSGLNETLAGIMTIKLSGWTETFKGRLLSLGDAVAKHGQ